MNGAAGGQRIWVTNHGAVTTMSLSSIWSAYIDEEHPERYAAIDIFICNQVYVGHVSCRPVHMGIMLSGQDVLVTCTSLEGGHRLEAPASGLVYDFVHSDRSNNVRVGVQHPTNLCYFVGDREGVNPASVKYRERIVGEVKVTGTGTTYSFPCAGFLTEPGALVVGY